MKQPPVGYFLLDRALPGSAPIADKLLANPLVVGQTIRVPWATVNPEPHVWKWAEVDARLDQCRRLNKQAKLLIQTGRDGFTPKWIGGQWIGTGQKRIPAPWSPQLRAAIENLAREAGKRYNANPAIVAAHATGPTWPSAEMHPMPGLASQKGYTLAGYQQGWQNAVAAWAEAFPDCAVCLSTSVQRESGKIVEGVISYARAKLGPRLRLQHNALAAYTLEMAPHHRLIAKHAKLGITVGFEMVTTVKDWQRFGSRDVMDGINIGKRAGGIYFDVYPQPEDVNGLRAA